MVRRMGRSTACCHLRMTMLARFPFRRLLSLRRSRFHRRTTSTCTSTILGCAYTVIRELASSIRMVLMVGHTWPIWSHHD